MNEQKARSREHWTGSGQTASTGEWLALRDRLGPTVFTGYDGVDGSGEVLALISVILWAWFARAARMAQRWPLDA